MDPGPAWTFSEEANSLLVPGFEHRFVQPVAWLLSCPHYPGSPMVIFCEENVRVARGIIYLKNLPKVHIFFTNRPEFELQCVLLYLVCCDQQTS